MTSFSLKLAGIPILVEALYESTKDFCKAYWTAETPLLSVALSPEDIARMRFRDEQSALSEGHPPAVHSDGYLETLALANVLLEKLIDYGVIMFHGAVIAANGKAYLFTAKSGTGKTTHCNLWLKNCPSCHILNGDKPLLRFGENGIDVCGSPWQGKENKGVNEILPLGGICILERDDRNHIGKITFREGLNVLPGQCHIPGDGQQLPAVVKLLVSLSSVPLYRLGCNMEDDAAILSYKAMVK